jgi:prephenate dehydrogenase
MQARTQPVIGVIGGSGQMGRWLCRFWQARGFTVLISDRETALHNEDVVRAAQVTFVAVPLAATPAVIADLAPHVSAEGAVVSIASLMAPSAAALAALPSESLCAHPVFGPTVVSTQDLPVVVAPVRGSRWLAWLVDQLREAGLQVRHSTPLEHDTAMGVVQALLHSLYVALCSTMDAAGLPPAAALEWASPTLRVQLGLMARILGQDAGLYADLVVGNPCAPVLLESLATQLQALAALARNGDREGFAAAFQAARSGFGREAEPLAVRTETVLERFA